MRNAAASNAFATPGVYWDNPQPARWAVPASDAKYEFLVYVREITDYIEQTFPALRDEVNDLPPTLAAVTKKLGKDAVSPQPLLLQLPCSFVSHVTFAQVPAALKNGNAFTLWSACGLSMTQNARAVPADGNVTRTDGEHVLEAQGITSHCFCSPVKYLNHAPRHRYVDEVSIL